MVRQCKGLLCAICLLSTAARVAALTIAANEQGPQQPPPFTIQGSSKPMPAIGFGTCCRPTANGQPLIDSTKTYLSLGGRLIDTAQLYGNHRALAVAIREGGVPRDELWVTSKINMQRPQTRSSVLAACQHSAQELGLDHIDLMLLHGGEGWGRSLSEVTEAFLGLVDAKAAGIVKNIGVSNIQQHEIEAITQAAGQAPAVNQIELHPWVSQEAFNLLNWCKQHGIQITAYGSLGGAHNHAQGQVAEEVAKKHGVSNAQVLLKWALQNGAAVIPGATSAEHIQQDLELMGFTLDSGDMQFLQSSASPADWTHWHNMKQ